MVLTICLMVVSALATKSPMPGPTTWAKFLTWALTQIWPVAEAAVQRLTESEKRAKTAHHDSFLSRWRKSLSFRIKAVRLGGGDARMRTYPQRPASELGTGAARPPAPRRTRARPHH